MSSKPVGCIIFSSSRIAAPSSWNTPRVSPLASSS
ncbi:Uncharacterised protein [Mycobacteroides abscessus subsp. abscessus]|nr:Uncharacterised protein [Mycobacteroides abscessus subsp. abscessus]